MQRYWPPALFVFFCIFLLALIDFVFFAFGIGHISLEKKKRAGGQCVDWSINYDVSKFQVQIRKFDEGMANLAFTHYFGWPSSYAATIRSTKRRRRRTLYCCSNNIPVPVILQYHNININIWAVRYTRAVGKYVVHLSLLPTSLRWHWETRFVKDTTHYISTPAVDNVKLKVIAGGNASSSCVHGWPHHLSSTMAQYNSTRAWCGHLLPQFFLTGHNVADMYSIVFLFFQVSSTSKLPQELFRDHIDLTRSWELWGST